VGQRRIRSVAFSKLSVILFLIALNYAGTVFHRRVDFTREQRYGLSSLTKSTLAQIDGLLYIQILLDGNLPPGFQQLRKAAADFLSDLRAESPRGTIHIEFENPF